MKNLTRKNKFIIIMSISVFSVLMVSVLVLIGIIKKFEKDNYLLLIEGHLAKGDSYLSEQKYKEAHKRYERADYFNEKIVLHKQKKQEYKDIINNKLSSQDLDKGMSGLVYYKDKWVKQEKVKKIDTYKEEMNSTFKDLLIQAKESYENDEYIVAAEKYKKAISLLEKNNFLLEKYKINNIKQLLAKAEQGISKNKQKYIAQDIKELLDSGNKKYKIRRYSDALTSFNKASALAKKHSFTEKSVISEIVFKSAQTLTALADDSLKDKNYKKAQEYYKEAHKTLNSYNLSHMNDYGKIKNHITSKLNSDAVKYGSQGWVQYNGSWIKPVEYKKKRFQDGYIHYWGRWERRDFLKKEAYKYSITHIDKFLHKNTSNKLGKIETKKKQGMTITEEHISMDKCSYALAVDYKLHISYKGYINVHCTNNAEVALKEEPKWKIDKVHCSPEGEFN